MLTIGRCACLLVGLLAVTACGDDSEPEGEGEAGAGGTSGSGGTSTGGTSGASGSGGTASSGTPACLPANASSRDCEDNPDYPYQYMCNAQQSAQPDSECERPTSALFPDMTWCCAEALCVRQLGTEYLCTDAAMPNSYLCHEDAPPPPGCVKSPSAQYCCP